MAQSIGYPTFVIIRYTMLQNWLALLLFGTCIFD